MVLVGRQLGLAVDGETGLSYLPVVSQVVENWPVDSNYYIVADPSHKVHQYHFYIVGLATLSRRELSTHDIKAILDRRR